MKKRIITLILCFCLVLSFVSFNKTAHADGLTLTTVSGLAYAIAQYSGLSFDFASATGNGVKSAMESYMNNWLDGRTVAQAFGSELARLEAGKLVVPAVLFNKIRDFLNDMVSDNNLETGDAIIFPGEIDGIVINNLNKNFEKTNTGFSVTSSAHGNRVSFTFYYNGKNSYGGGYNWQGISEMTDSQANGWTISRYKNNKVYIVYAYSAYRSDLKERQFFTHETSATIGGLTVSDTGTGSISGGYSPTVLNPTQDWATGSYVGPDTNLDQLMGSIFEEVADNNLVIDGEVIDPPVPPSPAPTVAPDIPLSDVPWEGLNDLIGQSTGETVDSINQGVQDITGALEGVQEGVQDITGAIEGVQEGVSGLTDTITEALTPPEIDERTFNLKEVFPFCIPFDIYHLLQKFDGTPTAPHVQLPIVIPSIGFSYTLDLDFSAWDPVADVMRTVELIVYALGLAWATSKAIKW